MPRVGQGRLYDSFHERRGEQVAVVGSTAAHQLGITTLETAPAVFIGEVPFTVVGVIEDVARQPGLLTSVLVPRRTAEKVWGDPDGGQRARMLISTDLGAASQIAAEAPLALDPAHPEYFEAVPPPDPRILRGGVTSDLDQLFLIMAGVCLVIGTVGIANTTLVAVMERTGEIGLRRSLGARGRHIMLQFLTESATLGTLGGLVGTGIGIVAIVATAMVREWTPVVHPATVVAAPAVGMITGLLAGLYPAWRAARIQPVEALRR